jgi:hypothetical protein
METEINKTSGKPPIKKRRLNTLLEAAVIVSSETLRMTAAANRQNPATVLLSSSPEAPTPSKTEKKAAEKSTRSPSPSSSVSSSECVKPFSLPLPLRYTSCGTPPMVPSSPEVPQAPYRATITSSKLPPSYPYGRKLEWTPEGHPVEPSPDKRATLDDVGNQQRPKTARRIGLYPFDCPDACINLSPVHIPPFQDAFQSRRTSSSYSFSSEESLRRKNMSPRKSAPKEP